MNSFIFAFSKKERWESSLKDILESYKTENLNLKIYIRFGKKDLFHPYILGLLFRDKHKDALENWLIKLQLSGSLRSAEIGFGKQRLNEISNKNLFQSHRNIGLKDGKVINDLNVSIEDFF